MKKYTIINIPLFVYTTRLLVYQTFASKDEKDFDIKNLIWEEKDLSKEEQDEFNKCLAQNEAILIGSDFFKKIGDSKGFYLSEEDYVNYLEALNSRLVSNILNDLVNKGSVETAFDPSTNDFIFWTTKNEEDKKPGT